MSSSPSLTELIKQAIESRLLDVHTAMIGQVERYNPERQLVDVKPIVEELLILPDVPVLFPRAGGFFISFPIQEGDFVQLLFNENPIDAWWSGEGQSHLENLKHGFAGAVAIPGVYPHKDSLKKLPKKALGIGHNKGIQIHVEKGLIKLGQDASEHVALASKVLDELRTLNQAFNTHVHGTAWGPSTPPTAPASPPQSVAAKKVVVE